jgi:hypothetical protein
MRALAFVFLLILAAPVMAAPATRIEGVTASIETETTNDWRIVDHDIWQLMEQEVAKLP